MDSSIDYSELPLRDIHLPEAVPWWPPAFGWWLLLAAGVAIVAAVLYQRHRMRRHRAALAEVARIESDLEAGADPVESLRRLSIVVRRFAMSMAGDDGARTVPGLVGRRWLEYLDARGGGSGFRDGPGRRLLDGPYLPEGAVTRDEAAVVARCAAGWIRAQRPRPERPRWPRWPRPLRATER